MRPEADAGTSNERTALAWQRTALALVAGAALIGRLTFDRLGWWSLLGAVLAAGLGAWVLLESGSRYVRRTPRGTHLRGGRAPAAVALATVVIAAVELAALMLEETPLCDREFEFSVTLASRVLRTPSSRPAGPTRLGNDMCHISVEVVSCRSSRSPPRQSPPRTRPATAPAGRASRRPSTATSTRSRPRPPAPATPRPSPS